MKKDVYAKNYNIEIKEIDEDSKNGKDIPYSWIGRSVPTTQSNLQVQGNLNQNSKDIFHRNRTHNSKTCM